jgi:hypothetical protein
MSVQFSSADGRSSVSTVYDTFSYEHDNRILPQTHSFHFISFKFAVRVYSIHSIKFFITVLSESLDSRVRNGSKIVEMLKIQINRKFSKVSFKVEQKSITVTLLNIRLCLIQ